MQTKQDILLSTLTTMRLGGPAHEVVTVTSKQELLEASNTSQPLLVLGEGSNMVVTDHGFAGRVILNRIPGFDMLSDTTVRIGAGEQWDGVVKRTVALGLSGIEALSAIPGTAGATPVQNVGAYGQEIAQTLVELEALNLQTRQFETLSHSDCQFAYRSSRFKDLKNRQYIITSITLKLSKAAPKPPFYASLQSYLDEHNIHTYSPQIIRDAVVAIRAIKLPDPAKVANSGSFFKNPIIPAGDFEKLKSQHPTIPHWPMPNGRVKVAAGWLIEQVELKGYEAHGMQVYPQNALVFINRSAKTYKDLAQFQQEVVAKVKDLFDISLEQEPELLD